MIREPISTRQSAGHHAGMFWITWFCSLLVGVGLALTRLPIVILPWGIAPLGNDAFYHATRMLAVAGDPSSIHEFDPLLHWPDGMWLVWPWAYDYLIGAVAGLLTLAGGDVMRIVIFTPLAWLAASLALTALIARQVLGPKMLVLLLLAVVASPLSISLHSVGAIDHHAAELFWTLATLLLLMRWSARVSSTGLAALLGACLAIATAFHNGLFILQVPVLATFFLARYRFGLVLPLRATSAFALALLAAQLLVLMPSAHFSNLDYAFYYLSWFHLHAAALTALAMVSFALPRRGPAVALLVLAIAGALPAAGQVSHGIGFMGAGFSVLGNIVEASSPYTLPRGAGDITRFYTAFLWLAPLTLLYALARAARLPRLEMELPLLVFAAFGLAMLMLQVRFQHFGLVFLFLLPLMFAQNLPLDGRRRLAYTALVLIAAFSFSISVYTRLPAPGLSTRWASGWPLLQAMETICEQQPGLLLAHHNWGNLVRYHTTCPLLSNNFIMTPADALAIERTDRLMAMTPEELTRADHEVRYVLVSAMDKGVLATHLLSDQAYPAFDLLEEAQNGQGDILGRAYRFNRPD